MLGVTVLKTLGMYVATLDLAKVSYPAREPVTVTLMSLPRSVVVSVYVLPVAPLVAVPPVRIGGRGGPVAANRRERVAGLRGSRDGRRRRRAELQIRDRGGGGF